MTKLIIVCFSMAFGVLCIDQACQFHRIYQTTSAKLEGERWLLGQCEDPNFFSKMHVHSDLCFTVSNNARVGGFMLSLRELTQSLLGSELFLNGRSGALGLLPRVFSWPFVAGVCLIVFFAPSWLVRGSRGMSARHRWPHCKDACFKDA